MENNRYREEELETEVTNEPTLEPQVEKEQKSNKKDKKLNKKIEELQLLNEELNNKLLNCQNEMLKDRAELENFKRRSNEERIKDRIYANQSVFTELVDIIDIFDKAVSVKVEDEKLKNYLLGFSMINTQIQQIMENYGVKKIDDLNKPFNSQYHEAIETVEVEGVEPNTVVEVVRDGYMFKDRIIRPSMVKVSK